MAVGAGGHRRGALEAMARQRHMAPRKRPRESLPPLVLMPLSPLGEASDIPVAPPLGWARQAMLQPQFQALWLYLDTVAQALARQATTWKSLLLVHHYEHPRQQTSSLHKEQTTRWYVEAQHAMCRMSWLVDSLRLHFRPWRMTMCPEVRPMATCNVAASLSWEQAHLLLPADIQVEEVRAWRHMSQVHTVTLTALWQMTLSNFHRVVRGDVAQHAKRPREDV